MPMNDTLKDAEPMKCWREYWDAYARTFAQPLQANGLLAEFVTNPNVTGAYAEAWVRSMTRNMLGHRFRISTGAVTRGADRNGGQRDVPQCDLIVWDPAEMPAIFEHGEFALVPWFAVRAIIEVKRTCQDPAGLRTQLKARRERLIPRGPILGVVIDHPTPLFSWQCTPDWLKHFRNTAVTQIRYIDKEPPMTSLLNGSVPDTNGIMAFIYFLAQVAGHTNTL